MFRRCALALFPLWFCSSCAFHSLATEWNHRVGPDGEPVFYAVTTQVGLRLLVVVPFLGRLGIDGQVQELTRDIAIRGGDRVRIVQGSTENYWYGFPPLTWVLTPVVTTLNAEYVPSESELRGALRRQGAKVLRGLPDDAAREAWIDAEYRRWRGESEAPSPEPDA
jgi:hypothetical protein